MNSSYKTVWFTVIFMLVHFSLFSRDTLELNVNDSLVLYSDTLVSDTLVSDTLVSDTNSGISPEALTAEVTYKALDSIRFNIEEQKVYLFKNDVLEYGSIKLEADYVEIDFEKKLIYAKGVKDSTGMERGKPVFTEGGQSFNSSEITYNFDSRKGIIQNVITQEGDGYLHGTYIKKMPDDIINIKYGKYTTCSHENPHFEFRFNKSKVIPNDKIITGPAYFVVEGVPTPLALPFGLFPNKSGQRSGILFPTYGESADRGFYLEDLGYYFAINDYIDLEVTGDIYSRGSWATKMRSSYNKRYKYRGSLGFRYAINILGTQGAPDYSKYRDFAINWNHQQSDKARPNSKFSASVNVVTSKFNVYNPGSVNDYLSNTFQSSIAYRTSWSDKYLLTASLNHSQNVNTHTFDLTLPQLDFTVNRFYPFRAKEKVGGLKWYDNISVEYRMNMKNELNTYDSLLFKENFYDEFRNGIKHSIPIKSTMKVLKYFNLNNVFNYTERWYTRAVEKNWNNDTIFSGNDTIVGYVERDTLDGFFAVRDFSFSTSLNTRFYGMIGFKKGPVRALRHVVTPSVGFSIRPDFGTESWGYYKTYVDGNGNENKYSLYEGSIYGTPPTGKSGRLNFSIANNLEMKVRSRKDTVEGMKKVVLIENFTLSTSYDLAKDSLNWSRLSLSGRTRLFKNFDIQYSSLWDPYVLDSTGTRNLNQFEWTENRRLFRHDNTTWNLSRNLRLNYDDLFKERSSEQGTEDELQALNENLENYVDFSVPWNLSISYNFRYTTKFNGQLDRNEYDLVQTLSFYGDLNITPKWKFGFRSGYDFESNEISYTSIDIFRDLHCWEMRFSWIPKGARQSWNFTINIKSQMLQDLKLNKKKDFRDF